MTGLNTPNVTPATTISLGVQEPGACYLVPQLLLLLLLEHLLHRFDGLRSMTGPPRVFRCNERDCKLFSNRMTNAGSSKIDPVRSRQRIASV